MTHKKSVLRKRNSHNIPQQYERRNLLIAAIIAGFVMLTTGIGYRVLKAWLYAPGNTIPLTMEDFAKLPMEFENWKGQEAPLDPNVVERTDSDAHVSRIYSSSNSFNSVRFYIAYGARRPRDMAPHRPEVCFTGAGWRLINSKDTELTLSDGTKLPCNVMQYGRGIFNQDRIVVLYYYIINDKYYQNVAGLRYKLWRRKVRYVAQVQIGASIQSDMNLQSAIESVHDFAVISASSTLKLIQDHESNEEAEE